MKTRLATYFTRWDVEEVLIIGGLLLLTAGVWMTWGPGPALTVLGALVLILGCAIAFWR